MPITSAAHTSALDPSRRTGTSCARASAPSSTPNNPPTSSPHRPIHADCSSTTLRRSRNETPSACSVAYSRTEPATAAIRVWLVITAPTMNTIAARNITPRPAPVSNIQYSTARRANAEAFVSVHFNAYPDGVNPFRARNGTNTYFFFDHAEPLARAVQRGLVREIGLPDMGINYDNLAVARQSWMPAILCEGAFLMIPEQEAALRDEAFQKRYAKGIADGLEEYFRALAGRP